MTNKNNPRNYSIYANMSTEMLEEILRADFQLPNSEDSDTDTILYIMGVIADREKEHKEKRITDPHIAWKSFTKNYLPYLDNNQSLYDEADEADEADENEDFRDKKDVENIADSKSDENIIIKTESKHEPKLNPKQIRSSRCLPLQKKPWLTRTACITAVLTIFLFTGSLTAKVFGFDLWDTVAKWTRETFTFSSHDMQKPDNTPEFGSLQEALDQYGIKKELVPTWLPEGYLFIGTTITETPIRTIFSSTYRDNEAEILIKIVSFTQSSTSAYEKDSSEVVTYTTNENNHYIMSNLDQTNVVWITDNYECSITGVFSLEEAKIMIDSIYKEKRK